MTDDDGYSEKDSAHWINELVATEVGEARREAAIHALITLGHAAIPSLIEALGHANISVNLGAGNALMGMGVTAFYDLRESLKHDNARVRNHAARLLYCYALRKNTPIVEAVAALIEALNDPDPDVRKWSVIALDWIGEEAEEAVPGLLATLDDEDDYVREMAAHALGSIGPASEEAVPKLTELLVDDDRNVRLAASDALDKICEAEDAP